MRSLRAPPEPVRDVLEGVLRLMGIADTSWHSMKMFLSKRGIKDDIKYSLTMFVLIANVFLLLNFYLFF